MKPFPSLFVYFSFSMQYHLIYLIGFFYFLLTFSFMKKGISVSSVPCSIAIVWCISESEVAQSCLTLCDPWTVAYQTPPSMGFSRQGYWSGLPFPSPVWCIVGDKYLLSGWMEWMNDIVMGNFTMFIFSELLY